MNKLEWIEKRAAYLINHEGTGIVTASILAKAIADTLERKIGPNVDLWDDPEKRAVHPLSFLTDPDEDQT